MLKRRNNSNFGLNSNAKNVMTAYVLFGKDLLFITKVNWSVECHLQMENFSISEVWDGKWDVTVMLKLSNLNFTYLAKKCKSTVIHAFPI